GPAGAVAAGGERGELGGAAGAGRPDEAEHRRPPLLERGEPGRHAGPFDPRHAAGGVGVAGEQAGRAVLGGRGRGDVQHPGEVEVGPVGGDGRGGLGEQGGERAVGAPGPGGEVLGSARGAAGSGGGGGEEGGGGAGG